jgi:hypothetical protein
VLRLQRAIRDIPMAKFCLVPQVTLPTTGLPATVTWLDDGGVLAVGDAGAARWSLSAPR